MKLQKRSLSAGARRPVSPRSSRLRANARIQEGDAVSDPERLFALPRLNR